VRYLLLIYGDEQARAAMTPAEQDVNMKDVGHGSVEIRPIMEFDETGQQT